MTNANIKAQAASAAIKTYFPHLLKKSDVKKVGNYSDLKIRKG